MPPIAREQVVLVEVLERTGSFEEFSMLIQAATHRLEIEGIAALVSMHFYAEPDSTEVGAVILFSDGRSLRQHIDMITGWPEFRQLLQMVRPIDIRVYGKIAEEEKRWLQKVNVLSKTFENPVAGFVRA